MKIKNVKRTKKNLTSRDRANWAKKNRGVPENRDQARARLICNRRSIR